MKLALSNCLTTVRSGGGAGGGIPAAGMTFNGVALQFNGVQLTFNA